MNPINEAAERELKPCPFCGCAMRIESNRDWHRLKGDHDEMCLFDADSEIGTMPATEEDRLTMVEYWNRRATLPPASGEAVAWMHTLRPESQSFEDGRRSQISFTEAEAVDDQRCYGGTVTPLCATQPAPEVQASHGAVGAAVVLAQTGTVTPGKVAAHHHGDAESNQVLSAAFDSHDHRQVATFAPGTIAQASADSAPFGYVVRAVCRSEKHVSIFRQRVFRSAHDQDQCYKQWLEHHKDGLAPFNGIWWEVTKHTVYEDQQAGATDGEAS
jgi:hypothetical protein